jgi:hypothetical protein
VVGARYSPQWSTYVDVCVTKSDSIHIDKVRAILQYITNIAKCSTEDWIKIFAFLTTHVWPKNHQWETVTVELILILRFFKILFVLINNISIILLYIVKMPPKMDIFNISCKGEIYPVGFYCWIYRYSSMISFLYIYETWSLKMVVSYSRNMYLFRLL